LQPSAAVKGGERQFRAQTSAVARVNLIELRP
jgi:hypothetical protein